MMCIIRIVDGAPFEHPIMLENFKEAFPNVDLENLPAEFALFERKLRPDLPANTVFLDEHPIYEFDGRVWTDVWRIRDKTLEENQQELKTHYGKLLQTFTELMQPYTDPTDIVVWQAKLDEINAVLAQTPVVFKVILEPRKDENGQWVTTTSSGSAPNVIG
jgi:hypothetical protein